jgi:hypothetical protein
MNRMIIMVLGAVLAASLCYGQGSNFTPAQAEPAAIGHGSFPVKVLKTLDSSKLKEGDSVEVETAGSFKLADGTLVQKGSRLTGHVTAAKARSKGDPESELSVVFDKLNVANGKQLSIKGTVQAVFPPPDEVAPQMAGKASGAAGGGYTGATVGTVTNNQSGSNVETSGNSQAGMDPKSVGVQGIRGLELNDGVLSSKGKNVKLGDGVRMIVRADILG